LYRRSVACCSVVSFALIFVSVNIYQSFHTQQFIH
jgi:hypothetical protein